MTKEQIQKRLDEIAVQIKTCATNALRFYDDSAEVSEQYACIDALIEEKSGLLKQLDA